MHSQQLEYFCKVAEHRSISRAAVAVGINQSALSRHIRSLEAELGIPLFYRNGRGVILTEHGERLLERAYKALEELALAKQEALRARPDVIGQVVIGLTPSVGRILVKPLAKYLTTEFPNIKLSFVEGLSWHLLEWLNGGRLDVAVVYKGWASGRLLSEKLITERLCLIGAKNRSKLGRRTQTAQLEKYPLILPSTPHGLRRLIDTVANDQGIKLNVCIEADSLVSILSLVRMNLGYTVLPAAAIQEELSANELHASLLVNPEVTRTLILVTPNNKPPIRCLGTITKLIKSELKKIAMT
jgi:LysR family transcriptional regulator, nitrogen assimilation regulatory protein